MKHENVLRCVLYCTWLEGTVIINTKQLQQLLHHFILEFHCLKRFLLQMHDEDMRYQNRYPKTWLSFKTQFKIEILLLVAVADECLELRLAPQCQGAWKLYIGYCFVSAIELFGVFRFNIRLLNFAKSVQFLNGSMAKAGLNVFYYFPAWRYTSVMLEF